MFDKDIPLMTECSKVSHSSAHYLLVHLCISSHLPQEETSLMKAKWDIDLLAQQNIIRKYFIAMFF